MSRLAFERFISKGEEKTYFTIPFHVPENVESMTVSYAYPRHVRRRAGDFVLSEEIAIVDLGLNAPGGAFVGASGSDRTEVTVSPFGSTPGYAAVNVEPGEWEIIVGAYKVPGEGVTVAYEIEFTEKRMRLFRGDLHAHTTGSDGVMTPEELAELCVRQNLDFVFVTNHNTCFENEHLPRRKDLTVIPGAEWTHYKGHANFLGIKKPYKNPFCVNTEEEMRTILQEARDNGALISLNHPFDGPCGWRWGMDVFGMDAVEVWNGGLMTGANEKCLEWWHDQLCKGRRLPVVGGSDFHRTGPFSLPGLPCTKVYALSRAPEDILTALRAGRCFISFTPEGPEVSFDAGEAQMGGEVPTGQPVSIRFSRLQGGDCLRVITDRGVTETICPAGATATEIPFRCAGDKFVRCEVLRKLLSDMPPVRVMVSNPLYFSSEE